MDFAGINLEDALTTSYHTIVVDHPYMHEMGLTSFTTGELYNWLIKRDANKDYMNLKLIGNIPWKSEDVEKNENKIIRDAGSIILGSTLSVCDDVDEFLKLERYYFTCPRVKVDQNVPQLRPVEYIKFEGWDKWNFTAPNGNTLYVGKDLNFDYFSNKNFDGSEIDPDTFEITFNDSPKLDGLNLDNKASNIIEMNNYIRLLTAILPESEWKKYSSLRSSSAISEFVRDIKSSKEQCIQWEACVPFRLNFEGEDLAGECIKSDKVKYKLYLFDTATPKDSSRKITFTNDFTIVGQHIDELGRVGFKEDGEIEPPTPEGDPNQSIAANLRVYYNPSTRKYESGTAQMLARMLNDLAPAVATDIDDLLKLSVKQLQDKSYQTVVAVGEAIPIINQNANPLLWAPEYGENKDCRTTEQKNTLKVINVSKRTFKRGDTVLLQNIGGAWIPSSLGEENTGGTASFDSKWGFSYLMTNADAFFRNIKGTDLTYGTYEQGVYGVYYADDELNAISAKPPYASIDVFNGYYHITSFDFMGKRIGGTRDISHSTDVGNSISCTQFSVAPDNSLLEREGKFLNGKTSAPFFGCVFPDGYSVASDDVAKVQQYVGGAPKTRSFQYDILYNNYSNAGIFGQIPVGENIFLNKNDNNKNTSDANKLGMFYAINSDAPDYSLRQLPADIGTNASPIGKWGSPITHINHIWSAFIPYPIDAYKSTSYTLEGNALPMYKFQQQVTNTLFHLADTGQYNVDYQYTTINQGSSSVDASLLTRYQWIYVDEGDDENKIFNSLFDLRPNYPQRIQFRPLKTELFACWEHAIRPIGLMVPGNKNVLSFKNSNAARGCFAAINWELLESESPIISLASLTRNNNNKWRNQLFWFEDYGVWKDPAGGSVYLGPSLRYNNDIMYNAFGVTRENKPNTEQPNADRFQNNRDPAYQGPDFVCRGGQKDGCAKCYIAPHSSNFPNPWWQRVWTIGGNGSQNFDNGGAESRGAGGYGIIAAQCELTAFEAVNFTTVNYLGVRSFFLNKTWYPSWGWSSDYNSPNTIALHGKLMHHWPRELTVYDPRFFAIFHFNPPGRNTPPPDPIWYSGIQQIEKPASPPTKGNEDYPDGIYSLDVLETSVDFQVPTLANGDVAPTGLMVFNNGAFPIGDTTGDPIIIRDSKYWRAEYFRRNKLLPYKYKKLTISIGVDSETIDINGNAKPASECASIFIQSGGANYKKTDTFTTIGGANAIAPILNPIVAGDGSITGFTYVTKKVTRKTGSQFGTVDDPQVGANFDPSDFLSKDDFVDGGTVFKIKIVPLVTSGFGFTGGVVKGITWLSPVLIDEKPQYATAGEYFKLSAEPSQGGERRSDKYDKGGSVESTVIKEVDETVTQSQIIVNKSKSNKYDLFLFFHNDISFCMMDPWDQATGGAPPVNQENHITLTIDAI